MIPIPTVTDLDLAFGNIDHLPKEVPEEFYNGKTKWNDLFRKWFFSGIDINCIKPKEGVDVLLAVRVLQAIMRSYAPPHEHKEAGVAYLMSEWFEDWSELAGEPKRE